jgi:magnesium-transporting ATPase (P-type)
MIKRRDILAIYLLSIITFGIYAIYWLVQTKKEMNGLGAAIPSAWLLIVPIANLYWMYKYCEAFSMYVKKDNNAILWFILYVLIGIIMPAIVQSELNKMAEAPQAAPRA